MMMTTMKAGSLLLNGKAAPQVLKGHPKIVRIERLNLTGETTNRTQLREIVEYNPEGQPTSRRVFREDGTVSYNFTYEYEDTGLTPTKILTADGSGHLLQTQTTNADGGLEVLYDAAGTEIERTITKKNALHGGTQVMVVGPDGEPQADLNLQEDNQGRTSKAELVFGPERTTLLFDVKHSGNGHVVTTCTTPEGNILMRTESLESELGEVLQLTRFPATNEADPHKCVDQIDKEDEMGNWTQKTISYVESVSGLAEPVETLTRSITYY